MLRNDQRKSTNAMMVGKLSYFLFEEGMISGEGINRILFIQDPKNYGLERGTLGPEDQASHQRGPGGLRVAKKT